jgi:hypothetical protein
MGWRGGPLPADRVFCLSACEAGGGTMSRYRNLDIWLTDKQIEALAKTRDDPTCHAVLAALDNHDSTRDVIGALVDTIVLMARQNAHFRKLTLDMIRTHPMPAMIFPVGDVEHIDGDPLNNDIENLRFKPKDKP